MAITLRGSLQGPGAGSYAGGIDEVRVYEARPGGPVVVGAAVPDGAGRFSISVDGSRTVSGRRAPAWFVEAYSGGEAVGRSAGVASADSADVPIVVPVTAANVVVGAKRQAPMFQLGAPAADGQTGQAAKKQPGRQQMQQPRAAESPLSQGDWAAFVKRHAPSLAGHAAVVDEVARLMADGVERGKIVRSSDALP